MQAEGNGWKLLQGCRRFAGKRPVHEKKIAFYDKKNYNCFIIKGSYRWIPLKKGKGGMCMEGNKLKNIEIELEAPADFTSPEVLYDDLVKSIRKYHPSDDLTMIEKAYQIARDAHKDQKRKSGEPYIIHPLCVAIILADLEMDKETIAAGILHDVVEDTVMTEAELTDVFGREVALSQDVFGHGQGYPRDPD